jgi:hypothetical protein
MTALTEGDLKITLPAGISGRKFDDGASHGLSHCMKAVDFIVELNDRVFFIECKDPDDPNTPTEEKKKYLQKVLSGGLDADLKTKYRDSFIFEWASGRVAKPIYYLVLIGTSALSEAELLVRTDALRRQIPLNGPGGKSWKKPFVAGCAVMNIATWNKALPSYPVSRISS